MTFDVAIVGAGMAGASLAFELAPHARVLLLEQENLPGYHTTGRSAALFSEVYGNEAIRALSRASRVFFEAPPPGFAAQALLTPRGSLFFAAADRLHALQALQDEVAPRAPHLQRLRQDEVRTRVPALREQAVHAGLYEPDACDIDVHALHQGYLRGARQHGAQLHCNAALESAHPAAGGWALRTRAGEFSAAVLVNAAGAWADAVAATAGAQPLGLAPLRRTAMVFEDRGTWASAGWPLVVDVDEQFYFKPESGRFLVSPADETPSPPCDAQPEEYDLAVLLDRVRRLTLLQPRRITGRWAGLRTFATDRTPVVGFDARVPGFFWLAGQGGYGIQTAPALAQLAASLLLRAPLPVRLAEEGVQPAALDPCRFGAGTAHGRP